MPVAACAFGIGPRTSAATSQAPYSASGANTQASFGIAPPAHVGHRIEYRFPDRCRVPFKAALP